MDSIDVRLEDVMQKTGTITVPVACEIPPLAGS